MPDQTVFDFIDAADQDGFVSFTIPANRIYEALPADKQGRLRVLLQAAFHNLPVFTTKLDLVRKFVDQLDATCEPRVGAWHVRLNLAKLVLLPGIDPKGELAQLREWFTVMREFFEFHARHRTHIMLANERDRHGRVYASVACKVSPWKGEGRYNAPRHTARLQAMVSQSPALTHLTREIALALGKMGPYSWVNVTEEQLFGPYNGPSQRHFRATIVLTQDGDEKRLAQAREDLAAYGEELPLGLLAARETVTELDACDSSIKGMVRERGLQNLAWADAEVDDFPGAEQLSAEIRELRDRFRVPRRL